MTSGRSSALTWGNYLGPIAQRDQLQTSFLRPGVERARLFPLPARNA